MPGRMFKISGSWQSRFHSFSTFSFSVSSRGLINLRKAFLAFITPVGKTIGFLASFSLSSFSLTGFISGRKFLKFNKPCSFPSSSSRPCLTAQRISISPSSHFSLPWTALLNCQFLLLGWAGQFCPAPPLIKNLSFDPKEGRMLHAKVPGSTKR